VSTQALLQALLERVRRTRDEGHDPLVVLDLDGTLYDNTPRTLRILQEFAHTHAARYPDLYEVVATLSPAAVHYRMSDTLGAAGIADSRLLEEVQAFWFERFFTNEYVLYDLPLAGAVEMVQLLHREGAVPTYLTGRDAPNMLQGTVASLQRDGFPVGRVDTRAILKQDFETPDKEYKESVVDHLRRTGRVVGAFDNEPGLCNLFKEAFPDAVVVWLDTSHGPGAPRLRDDVTAIRRFTELLPGG